VSGNTLGATKGSSY